MRRPNFEWAAGAGIHMLDMSIKLSGNATITDANGNVSAVSYTSSNSQLPSAIARDRHARHVGDYTEYLRRT